MLSKASNSVTVTSVDSARLRSGSRKASCRLRSTGVYRRIPEASMRGSRALRPKKVRETASNALEIMGENMRMSAAARIAPACPEL
jgi:hypothetical protein